MVKALIGDLFASRAQTLVNTVNCVGVMGKGVAAQFKARYPAMFADYKRRCDQGAVRLGEPYLYRDLSGRQIVNFPTKGHWRSPSRLSYIERGLETLAARAADWQLGSVAMPPLGCGNGGLDWTEVGPLIYRKLDPLPIDVELYAPYGTPPHQLSADFLSAPAQMSLDGQGRGPDRLKPSWTVLVEVLRGLQAQPYTNPVGRTIFQKICYVVTEMGVPTGFAFGRGSYGPFSDDVKAALHVFANRNWVTEQQLGSMLALRVAPEYERDRHRYTEVIQQHARQIDKAIDLFSRIKSTEQAENVFTVLYASRQLKHGDASAVVEEEQIRDYILQWKKSWNTAPKRAAISDAIQNLVMLGWMRARLSESAATL